jgi:hypothetical protein
MSRLAMPVMYKKHATKKLIKFNTPDPRRNLPSNLAKKRGESNYLASFERTLLARRRRSGIGGRNFEMNGYGIADFVWVEKSSIDFFGKTFFSGAVKIVSFELKLSKWKQALTQAYRYSYFSDLAVVVLPTKTCAVASKHLALFKKMRIGLWRYDTAHGRCERIYEPLFSRPKNASAKLKALSILSGRSKFGDFFK